MKPTDAINVMRQYQLSEKDMARYNKLIQSGEIEKAMDEFINKYVLDAIETYNDEAMKYFEAGTSGQVDKKNQVIMYGSIIGLSLAFKNTVKDSIAKIFKSVSKQVFIDEGITNVDAKNAILEDTLNRFNQLIEGAMSETQAAILQPIRDAQRMFITANQAIANNNIKSKELDLFVKKFKKNIALKIPQIEKFAKDGLLMNRNGKSYQFKEYFEMATRTTALNIQRHAVEYMAEIDQDQIIEYYLADNRKLKTHAREICKSVIGNKINGKSYVALTDNAASKLGIKLLSSVQDSGGLKLYCRHSLRKVPQSVQKELMSA